MEQSNFYIPVGEKKIQATEEQARAHMRSRWNESKRQERDRRCLDEKGRTCRNDCSTCDNERRGRFDSLDILMEAGFDRAEDFDLEEFVSKRILLQELERALADLDPQNRKIAELYGQGYSEREIGTAVGVSQKTVCNRKKKIFAQLREELEGFQ